MRKAAGVTPKGGAQAEDHMNIAAKTPAQGRGRRARQWQA